MWVASNGRKSKVVRKDFGDDFASARKLYLKARDAGKASPTLACVNMGFPPPVSLRPHTIRKKGRDKRTRKVRVVYVNVEPLRELNLQGKLWCPHCMALRPFVLRKTFKLDGIRVTDPRYVCPICGVSHRDHNVRVWNPTAEIHMSATLATRSRTPKKARTRRRRTRA